METLDVIRQAYAKLETEIAEVDAQAAPIIARGKIINAKVVELQAELRAINAELAPLRGDDYRAKRKLLGQLAGALGGKTLKAEPKA